MLKQSRVLQLCSKHERKRQQFQAQASKAGKAEDLSQMEGMDTMRYLELFDAYCTSSEMRGRPSDAKKIDWSVVSYQCAGVRDSCETVSEFLCDTDFVNYYMHKAPGYERALAIGYCHFAVVSCQIVSVCHCLCFILLAVPRIEQGRCTEQMGSRLCQ